MRAPDKKSLGNLGKLKAPDAIGALNKIKPDKSSKMTVPSEIIFMGEVKATVKRKPELRKVLNDKSPSLVKALS